MNEKDAYRILDVSETADKTEITRRYEILLKRNKIARSQGGSGQDIFDLKEIDKAYNLLMGYDTENMVEDYEIRENKVLSKAGLDEKKLRNFFYYYKFHLIIGLVILIVLGTTIHSFLTKPKSDFYLVFAGDFYYGDSDPIKSKITDKVPDIKHATIDSALSGENAAKVAEYNSDMKIAAILSAGDVDVFITDKLMYKRLAKQGAFINLDEYQKKYNIDMDLNSSNLIKSKKDSATHLYGIDVSKSSFFNKPSVVGSPKIVSISIHVKHPEKAEKFLKYLLKTCSND